MSVVNVSQYILRVFHHTKSMDASINPILAITVVVIPASVTLHEGFEHAVLDAVSVVGLIRPPVGVLSYRVAFVPTKFSLDREIIEPYPVVHSLDEELVQRVLLHGRQDLSKIPALAPAE